MYCLAVNPANELYCYLIFDFSMESAPAFRAFATEWPIGALFPVAAPAGWTHHRGGHPDDPPEGRGIPLPGRIADREQQIVDQALDLPPLQALAARQLLVERSQSRDGVRTEQPHRLLRRQAVMMYG